MNTIKLTVKKCLHIAMMLSLLLACQGNVMEAEEIESKDFFVAGEDGVQLFVREFNPGDREPISAYPLLLIHGGGPGSVSSFDLDVPNGSLAKDLAKKGLKVYLMNIRGWEQSTLPDYDLKDTTLIVGNHWEASSDIKSVVACLLEKEDIDRISLFGWATGGHWGGYFTSQNPDKVAHFISLNSLYGVAAPWELKHFFWKEPDTTAYQGTDPFRTSNKEGLVRKWTSTIPVEDKTLWRDPEVMEAYSSTAISFGKDTTLMKVPGGYREESFHMSNGKKYWDARSITCPTLILRTDLDFWSRPEDLEAIDRDLTRSTRKRVRQIPGTHYVFLDRPERGRTELIREIVDFLNGASPTHKK